MNEDQTRHLVIFKNGIIIVTEPSNINDHAEVKDYQDHFRPNANPYFTSANLDLAASDFASGYVSRYNTRTLLRNDKPEDITGIGEAVDTAIDLAKKLKVVREQAKRASIENLIEKVTQFLKPSPESSLEPPMIQPDIGSE